MIGRRFYVLIGIFTLALAILGAILGTWWDEEYTLATTAHGAVYAFGRALSFELQAPLYFVLLALWRGIDSSVFFARLFSVLCVAAFAFAARAIALRIRPSATPAPFVLLAVLNPFVVFAALEIRLYALALLCSALLWILFYDGFLTDDRPRARIWLVAVAIVSIYVQYFLAFALIAGLVALIVTRRYSTLRSYLPACALVAVAVAPAAWWAYGQAAAAYLGQESIGAILARTVQPVVNFALPRSYDWTGPWRLLVYARNAAGLVVLIALVCLAVRRLDRREWALLALPVTMWCLFFLGSAILHVQYTLPRHFVGLFVPEFAALYVVVSRLVDGRAKLALSIAVVYSVFAVAALGTAYRSLAKPGDWPRVATYLSNHANAGDRIAVFPARGVPALIRSYRGPATVVPFPRPENMQRYDESSAGIASASDASSALERLSRGHHVLLVIAENCADAGAADGCGHLEDALAQRYPSARVTAFYLNRIVDIPAEPDSR